MVLAGLTKKHFDRHAAFKAIPLNHQGAKQACLIKIFMGAISEMYIKCISQSENAFLKFKTFLCL